jgi:excisionase family DNA binding protein
METEWLTEVEVLKILGVSRQTLYNLRKSNKLPFYKVGRNNRYLKADVDARNTPQLKNQAESKLQPEQKASKPNTNTSSSDDDYFI